VHIFADSLTLFGHLLGSLRVENLPFYPMLGGMGLSNLSNFPQIFLVSSFVTFPQADTNHKVAIDPSTQAARGASSAEHIWV
jgi:hypothetical protein